MKRWIAVILLLLSLLALTACGKTKIVHCDACGKEVKVPADSNIEEDWIFLCEDCAKQLESAEEAP